ncbi:MAG: amidohydrolase family protein, partial [Planctomycetota bacterium]
LVPITSPPVNGGVVSIAEGQIVRIGNSAESGFRLYDLGDVALLPGFVNAHTHLEFSALPAPLGEPGVSLPNWIQMVIASRKQRSETSRAIRRGLVESARAGVTTIGDIATSAYPKALSELSAEVVAFQEVIGFSSARRDSVFSELQARLAAEQKNKTVGISPHAPYTVHPDLLSRLVELADERRLPMAMHLAESREELQLLGENRGPFRELLEGRSMWDDDVFARRLKPLDYLLQLSAAPRALIIHGNYLDAEELDFVAANDHLAIVYCPRTHHFFGHDNYALADMLKRGANVAVGTDSRASNPDLSVLAELQFIAKQFADLNSQQILRLGTIAGARALGMDHRVGSLEVGKRANLTAVPCTSTDDPMSAILHDGSKVARTWIAGREVTAGRAV